MAKEPTHADRYVGTQIRIRRKQLGMSQGQLAGRIGVTFQQVQKYEKGVNRVGAGRLTEISQALQVPVTYFFAADGEVPSETTSIAEMLGLPGSLELLTSYAAIAGLPDRKVLLGVAKALAAKTREV